YAIQVSGQQQQGLLVFLGGIGPPCAIAALLGALEFGRSRRIVVGCAALVLAQAVTLSLSGFRGAGPLYIVAALLCGALSRDRAAPRPARLRALVLLGAVALMAVFVVVGSVVRENAAVRYGSSANAHPAARIDTLLPIVVDRFDRSGFLWNAIRYQDDPQARS